MTDLKMTMLTHADIGEYDENFLELEADDTTVRLSGEVRDDVVDTSPLVKVGDITLKDLWQTTVDNAMNDLLWATGGVNPNDPLVIAWHGVLKALQVSGAHDAWKKSTDRG